MKRTAFVCLGSGASANVLTYQELPTKESGEEFFIFLDPGNEEHASVFKQLFREAISTPRMGNPMKYFLRFIDRLNAVAGGMDRAEELLTGAVVAIMIRRGRDTYLFHNAAVEVAHWDGAAGEERPIGEIPGISGVPLRTSEGQGNLFSRFIEELFVLRAFTLSEGSHTLVLAPSRDFVSRNREALRNSIFFPAFSLPQEREVPVETGCSFPAVHWNTTGEDIVREPAKPERSLMRKISIPATVGILTGLIAIILFFGPWSRRGSGGGDAGGPVLLTAEDDGPAATGAADGDRAATPVEEEVSAAIETGEAIRTPSLSPAWSKKFTDPVTTSPRYHAGSVYFGCRDRHIYAFSQDGKLKWKYDAGEGVGASPYCISRYVICADYGGEAFCLNADTGEKLWSYETGERIVSSPRARDGMVCIATMGGELHALNLSDGAKRWSQKLGEGIWATVFLGGNYIIAATTDGSLVRLDHDGTIEWRTKPGGGILSSPLCLEAHDLVVFGSKDTYIYAYSLSGGNLMWRAAAGGEVNGGAVSDGETILIGSDDGYLYALSTAGRVRWKRSLGGAVKSTPLISAGIAYVTSYGSKIYAIDLKSGEVVSEHRTDAPIYSSPAHDGVRVYFGSNSGIFHALWMYGGVG